MIKKYHLILTAIKMIISRIRALQGTLVLLLLLSSLKINEKKRRTRIQPRERERDVIFIFRRGEKSMKFAFLKICKACRKVGRNSLKGVSTMEFHTQSRIRLHNLARSGNKQKFTNPLALIMLHSLKLPVRILFPAKKKKKKKK